MEVFQAIKDAENALRDIIHYVLEAKYGADWNSHLGVSEERINRWRERQLAEEKRNKGTPVEPRLLYYADFYDIWVMLSKNWALFEQVLGEKKAVEVWLKELERLRDPNAHNRDLLPFQKHLALGLSGDLRARIIRYRNKMENADDYFAKIESARDSVGNVWPNSQFGRPVTNLRVGDELQIVVTATDPLGEPIEYGYRWHVTGGGAWQNNNLIIVPICDEHVGKDKELLIKIRTPRPFKAKYDCDDTVIFKYTVLPRETTSAIDET